MGSNAAPKHDDNEKPRWTPCGTVKNEKYATTSPSLLLRRQLYPWYHVSVSVLGMRSAART